MSRRALVTGAAGFIGSALCKALVKQGWAVLGLDALTYAAHRGSMSPELDEGRLSFVQANICDGAAVRQALARFKPSHVFHLAAETHVDRSIDGPLAFIETNVAGTATLLDEVLDYWRTAVPQSQQFRFLHVSTDEVFGALGPTGAFTEASPYAPNSPYAASKAGADHLVRAWSATYRLPVLITNCCNNYGPRQFPEKLIPLMILKALAGETLPVFGDGSQVRDWIHVDDHASALIAIAERGVVGETYLVGAGEEVRNLDLVQAIAACMDARRPNGSPHARLILHVEDRPGHDFRYAVDAGKLHETLNWRPRRSLEDGLRETVDWYLEHPEWWRAIQDGTYHGERLGTR